LILNFRYIMLYSGIVERVADSTVVTIQRGHLVVADVWERPKGAIGKVVAQALRQARARHRWLREILGQRGRRVRVGPRWVMRRFPSGDRAMRRELAALDEVLRLYGRRDVL